MPIAAATTRFTPRQPGGEMTVAVTAFEGLDSACASVDSIADYAGAGASESGLAILFPDLV